MTPEFPPPGGQWTPRTFFPRGIPQGIPGNSLWRQNYVTPRARWNTGSNPAWRSMNPRTFFPRGIPQGILHYVTKFPPSDANAGMLTLKYSKRWNVRNVDTEVQQTVECKECWPPSTANGGMLTLKYSQRWHVTFDRSIWHWSTANQRNVRNVAPQVQPAVTCHFWQVNLTLKYSQNGCTSVSNAPYKENLTLKYSQNGCTSVSVL